MNHNHRYTATAMTARWHHPATTPWPGARQIALLMVLSSLTALPFLICLPAALAQIPPADNTAAAPQTANQTAKPFEPLPRFRMEETKADRLPYTTWKTHLGPAAEALVTASVTTINRKTGETITRTGVGVVIRCDGFVLLPASLFPPSLFPRPGVPSVDRRQAPDRIAAIDLHLLPTSQKGATESGTVVPASFSATLTRYTSQSVPYVLVKAQNVHLPAAALLHPRNISSAGGVEVVFPRKQTGKEKESTTTTTAASAATTVASAATTTTATTTDPFSLQRLKARVVSEGNGVFSLALEGGDAAAASSIPPGAIVVDTTAKMVLGIVAPPLFPPPIAAATPSNQAALPFHSFEHFHDITNAVALVPAPDERLQAATVAARKAGLVQDGMVWIPGGPLTVEADANPELEGASIACTPGFWIDQNEVTLAQYKAFMKATGYHPQSGVGLVDEEKDGTAVGPHDDAVPVHGVSLVDAEAYATWKGCRLATPLEWQWASRGGDLLPVQSVPANGGSLESRPVRLPLLQMDIKAFKLGQFDTSVVSPGAAWVDSYARAHGEVERNTRVAMLLIGYNEAKYWSYFRLWPKNVRHPFGGAVVSGDGGTLANAGAYIDNPEFKAIVDRVSITPSSTIRDSSYAQALDNLGALWELKTSPNNVVLFGYGESLLNAMMRPDILQIATRLMTDTFDPVAIVPISSHAYDRSLFDVRHTQTNLHEWLQPNLASSADPRAIKQLPPLFDPGKQRNWEQLFQEESLRRLTAFNAAINNGNVFNPTAVGSRIVFSRRSPHPTNGRSGDEPTVLEIRDVGAGYLNWDATARNVSAFPTPLLPFVRIGHPEDAPDLGTGFRCAR